MSRRIAVALFCASIPAHAAPVCLEPAARSALVDMVVNHNIEQPLPPGWTIDRINLERPPYAQSSVVNVSIHAPDPWLPPWPLMLYATDVDDQPLHMAPLLAHTPAAAVRVLQDVTAAINAHMPPNAVGPCDEPPPPPHDTGPAPWSRARALIVGAFAALSILGALVFVLIQ